MISARLTFMLNKEFKYTEKPNNILRISNQKMKKSKSGVISWTENEAKHRKFKNRLFDFIPEPKPTKADIEPLFSSFNAKGIFIAPPSSKEALQRQMEK